MKKYWYYILNIIAIIIGVYIWGYSFFYSELNLRLLAFVAVCGIFYVGYSAFLLFVNRVKFDWHLMKGNYILKVLALVVYIPFIITLCYHKCGVDHLPKTLVYEENLYKPDTLAIPVKDTLSMEAMHPLLTALPDIAVSHDTLFVAQSCLPDTLNAHQKDPSLFWTVYYHFIDPGNQHMTTTPRGRLWAAIIGIMGVFLLNGLLVSAIVGWIDTRKEKWLKGEVKYKWLLTFCPHYVIIGGNDIVAGIVKQLFEAMEKPTYKDNSIFPTYILIQTSSDVESFRRELFTGLTEKQQQRVIVYYGSRTSKEDIAALRLSKAKEVFILGEDTRTDDIESYHDTMNMECLRLVSEQVKNVVKFCEDENKIDNRLVCRVMFEYQTTFNIFQITDIDGNKIKFLPFNYYEMWAQKVLVCQIFDKNPLYLPLENVEGIKADSQSFVHFVVVGMSRMGLAMAIEAAHLAHYPNFETNGKRTRITFIDSSMDQEKHFFMGRFKEMFAVARYRDVYKTTEDIYSDTDLYPWLDPLVDEKCKSPYKGDYLGKDFVDVEWEFVNGSIENPYVQQYLEDAASNPDAKLTIAVCLPENSRSIAAAAYLPDAVYSSPSTLQVLVYQKMNDDLVRQISGNNYRYHKKLRAFGMKNQGYDASLVELSEYIGKRIDEAYNAYTKSRDEEKEKLCKGMKKPEDKTSAVPENTSNELKGKSKSAKWWSNKYNIYTMWTKFRCMSDNPENLVQNGFDAPMLPVLGLMEHNRWVVEQLLLRYRPLRKDEQEKAKIVSLCSSDKEKNRLKKENYAHLDICSNAILDKVDFEASKLDTELIKKLPEAYKDYRELKREKYLDKLKTIL